MSEKNSAKQLKKLADELEDVFTEINGISNFLNPDKTASNPLRQAFDDFLEDFGDKDFALIGALAVDLYLKSPRATSDIDLLFKSEADIAKSKMRSEKFKRTRDHAFEHKETGVEIELLTPEFLDLSMSEVSQIINRSQNHITLPEDLLKLKLKSGRFQDIADIIRLVQADPDLRPVLESLPESKAKTLALEELTKGTLEERDLKRQPPPTTTIKL